MPINFRAPKPARFYKVLFLALAAAGFLHSAKAVAAPSADLADGWPNRISNLTVTTDGTSLVLPAALINSWQGAFTLARESSIKNPSLPLNAILGQYAGRSYQIFSQNERDYHFNPAEVYAWLKTQTLKFTRAPVEPKFILSEDSKAQEFAPAQTGKRPDLYVSTLAVLQALEKRQAVAALAVDLVEPKTSLAQTNTLGIKELIGRGESNFAGSPKNRLHNILVGIEKQKGVIIAPGQEFSFNRFLGPVEASAGFLPELVIKRTGTVPELGGGLCQVSSTTFRAAVISGLPITQRKNHSYAVRYYAPQGTDATIYPGVIDLKFLNDTPGSILVWPYVKNKTTLVFDFYGTKDSRQISLDQPLQYDRQADGAVKAVWTREVIKDGQKRSDVFKSVYLPPALFHKAEEFVPQTHPAQNSPGPGQTQAGQTPDTNETAKILTN